MAELDLPNPRMGLFMCTIDNKPMRVLKITHRELIVGRSWEADIRVQHPAASLRHIRFYVNFFEEGKSEPLVFCEDLESTNGTRVNDHWLSKGESVLLFDNDRIEIPFGALFVFRTAGKLAPLDKNLLREERIFKTRYNLTNRQLGTGSFGTVMLAKDVATGKQVACKIVHMDQHLKAFKSQREKEAAWNAALREVLILGDLDHPNIIKIHSVFQTPARIYLFQELITHGDLFSYMAKKDSLVEVETFPIAWQILEALRYLHNKKIVHRDLKPENILLATRDIGGRVILTDFGTARLLTSATRCTTHIGTPEFSAPEIFSVNALGYSKEVDLWSFGVVMHNLLVPRSSIPHSPTEMTELFHKGDLRILHQTKGITFRAKDFISQLLCLDPKQRLTANTAFNHIWLSRHHEVLIHLHARAIRGWVPRENKITMESIISDSQIDEPYLPYEIDLMSDDDLVGYTGMCPPRPPRLKDDTEPLASGWIPESPELWESYDKVAKDGKMRTAAQLQAEARARRDEEEKDRWGWIEQSVAGNVRGDGENMSSDCDSDAATCHSMPDW